MTGVYELNSDEIQSIQDLLDMNRLQFAKVIGLDRGSLVNIYKRNSCSQPVQILIIERMKMELEEQGSVNRLYDSLTEAKTA